MSDSSAQTQREIECALLGCVPEMTQMCDPLQLQAGGEWYALCCVNCRRKVSSVMLTQTGRLQSTVEQSPILWWEV